MPSIDFKLSIGGIRQNFQHLREPGFPTEGTTKPII